MSEEQIVALVILYHALNLASDTINPATGNSLLDELTSNLHPNVINRFCDVVAKRFYEEYPMNNFILKRARLAIQRRLW